MSNQNKQALIAKVRAHEKEIAKLNGRIDGINQVEAGDRPAPDIAARIKSQRFSFTVEFTRKKELRKVKKKGLIFTSDRRFSSAKEANHHGSRFAKKHGHREFHVVKVGQRANAWINWKTGKTNPVIGL